MGDSSAEMMRLSKLLDQGLTALREAAQEVAETEHAYRLSRAQAWVVCKDKGLVVPEREAFVDAETAEQRLERDLAEGRRQAALEAVRSRRQQLSAWQSWVAAERAEAEFARTAP